MNLSKLFEMQKALDENIIQTKGLEGQDLLPMKILALQVELGECANEWRGFKFWSENKEPRTEKLLVEYVDCLHFILSIGLELGCDKIKYWNYHTRDNTESHKSKLGIVDQFIQTITFVCDIYDCTTTKGIEYYGILVSLFIGLGEMLGFSWEQIEAAYTTKWEINHQRQQNGY